MSYQIRCCNRCGALEHGHTGPGGKYICTACWKAGWRVDEFGNLNEQWELDKRRQAWERERQERQRKAGLL